VSLVTSKHSVRCRESGDNRYTADTVGTMSALPSTPEVELASPPAERAALPEDQTALDPRTSLSALASSLDAHHADIPGFLNSLLSSKTPSSSTEPGLGSLDKELNGLLTRLSLLSQDTSSSLEQSIHDISRTVPRLSYDLQFMRESASSLQTSLHSVQDRVARQTRIDRNGPLSGADGKESDDIKTHRSMEKLTHLDKLKNRMESARDILREAESWSTLEGEITSFIASQSWSKAGNRLAEASRSMVVFQNTPAEFESRKALLVSLQNELETSLSAALEDSLAKNDVEAIGKFYEIFEMMDRIQEFKGYYFGARRKGILDEWSNAVLLDALQSDGKVGQSEPVKYSVFLSRFYASLLSSITNEKNQIPLIFPPQIAQAILATFIQTTLDALSPSLQSRLGSVADFYGSEALPELIKAYKATQDLGVSIQGVMDKMAFNTQGGMLSGANGTASPDAISPGTSIPKSRSRRLSLSRRFSRATSSFSEVTTSSLSVWETTLYEPFLDLQMAYPSLERKYLAHQLRFSPSLSGPSSRSSGDIARLLSELSLAAVSTAEEAINRCIAFTHGFGSKGLIDALNTFFEGFLDSQHDLLEKADNAGSGKKAGRDELDLDGLDYTTEDWGSFQTGLHVLSTCKDVRDRLSAFEERLSTYLIGVTTILAPDAATPDQTTRGAISLLQQSPLNSSELQTITSSSNTSKHHLQSARTALGSLTRTAQRRLQAIILAPIISQLNTYPTLAVWAAPDKTTKRGELSIPTFSLSPTDIIVRVSEGLLNLLRVFEVYASDASLSYSIETLPFVDPSLFEANVENENETRADKLVSPTSLTHPTAPTEQTMAPETVLSTWISSLTLSLLAHLSSITLPSIRSLSNSGAKQLEADLDYLSNAVRALDVEWEELEKWKEGVGMSVDELRQKARSGVDRSVLDKITRMKEKPT
jgi:hypothetical protein